MTLMIKSCPPPGVCGAPATGSPCDPCPPPPPQEGGGPGTGLPPFTDAEIEIDQLQYYQSTSGQISHVALGSVIIWTAKDNIPVQGAFGTPGVLGPPSYGFAATWVVYRSGITITAPYYPPGSYNSQLPDITTTQLGAAPGDPVTDTVAQANFQSANTSAGNAAIAQANQILGNP